MNKKSKRKSLNREAWLTQLINELDEVLFDSSMPKFRVTCGFPSKGGTGNSKRVIGQCWSPEASSDGTTEIIMTILIDDEIEITATVAHEMIHAIEGVEEGHGRKFGAHARRIGLMGKLTATTAGDEFIESVKPILKKLGNYPHAKIDKSMSPTKKQSTRMLKAQCNICGYTVRLSRKWANVGEPICPNGDVMEIHEQD